MWKHLLDLYKNCAGAKISTLGLTLLPRLKYEHVYRTSFSKMRVDLAAQVSCYCYLVFYYSKKFEINTLSYP